MALRFVCFLNTCNCTFFQFVCYNYQVFGFQIVSDLVTQKQANGSAFLWPASSSLGGRKWWPQLTKREIENWRKTFACQPFNEGNRSKSGQMHHHHHQCSWDPQFHTQWYRFLHNFLIFLILKSSTLMKSQCCAQHVLLYCFTVGSSSSIVDMIIK